MRNPCRLSACAALLMVLAASAHALAQEPEPSPSAVLFGKKCGSCHTLGEGDRTGPDLLGVLKRRDPKWVARFIREPGVVLDAGDPIANDLLGKFKNVRMPDQALGDDELEGMLAYIEACTAAGGCKLVLGKIKHANEATPADVEAGRRLFAGETRLTAGGPSCLSCHHVRDAGVVGGGSLAKDLTFAYARLGDTPISAALATPQFPLMKDIYGKQALTTNEAFQIKAYLATIARDGRASRPDHNFLYLGVIGLVISLGGIGLLWHGRMRGVREDIVKRGHP
jgi:mono/diheme cytochrome c family protein